MTQDSLNRLSYLIISCAIRVHKELGPNLLEKIYQQCMLAELAANGLSVASEQLIQISYRGLQLEAQLRCDIIVNDLVVVELKNVEYFSALNEAQLLSYMKLLKKPKGVLINFKCANLAKEGMKTYVNEYYRNLPKI